MADFFVWEPIDFIFDLATTNLAAGGTIQTGQAAAHTWRGENQSSNSPYQTDSETVAELSGIEIFGPYVGNRRPKIGWVRPVIDGVELGKININEMMAPGSEFGGWDPMGAAGMRYGSAMINFGMPLMAGGLPSEATPKIGAGETLVMKVYNAPTAEGGEALSTPMVVRAWICKCHSEDKLNYLLDYYHGNKGSQLFNGGRLNCSFEVGDLELGIINTYEKYVGSGGKFKLGDWTMIHGGSDVNKPKIETFISYARNAAATTANTWYQHTQDGSRVLYDWQELRWKNDKKVAHKITHVGVDPHKDLKYLRLYRSNRAIEYIHEVNIARNPLPMPGGQFMELAAPMAPYKLPKSYLVYNEIGSVEAMDDGTAVPAHSASGKGYTVAVWGKRFEMEEA